MGAESPAVPVIPPALLDAPQTCGYLGIGKTHLHEMIRAGKFGPSPVRLGRCVRYRRVELDAWLAAGCPSRERWAMLSKVRADQ